MRNLYSKQPAVRQQSSDVLPSLVKLYAVDYFKKDHRCFGRFTCVFTVLVTSGFELCLCFRLKPFTNFCWFWTGCRNQKLNYLRRHASFHAFFLRTVWICISSVLHRSMHIFMQRPQTHYQKNSRFKTTIRYIAADQLQECVCKKKHRQNFCYDFWHSVKIPDNYVKTTHRG